MNLDAYFQRINYSGSTEPTFDTLQALQRAHLYAVPFENLNIHIPKPIILDETLLFDKIVNQGRGGFCFEQNGVFSMVLRELGFNVTLMQANVYSESRQDFGVPFGHLTLMVELDVRYLVDVGFGSAFTAPLRIDDDSIQVQDVGQFRIEHDGVRGLYYEQTLGADKMELGYRFYFEPRELSDFVEACEYMQTSPDTHFTQKRISTIATPDGRITLSEGKFITTSLAGERKEQPVPDEAEFHRILRERFDIDVQTIPPHSVTEG